VRCKVRRLSRSEEGREGKEGSNGCGSLGRCSMALGDNNLTATW
jgi:hypothetical protein